MAAVFIKSEAIGCDRNEVPICSWCEACAKLLRRASSVLVALKAELGVEDAADCVSVLVLGREGRCVYGV